MNGMISVVLTPLKTVSEANKHTHWRDRQKRAKGQHQFACLLTGPPIRAAGIVPGEFKEHLVITLTRLSPQQLDSDNLAGSTKFVQDGVAEALGVDDRDPRLTWVYKQEKCKEYGVRVDIEPRREKKPPPTSVRSFYDEIADGQASAEQAKLEKKWTLGFESGVAVAGLIFMAEAIRNRPPYYRCKVCKDQGEWQDFSDVYTCYSCSVASNIPEETE